MIRWLSLAIGVVSLVTLSACVVYQESSIASNEAAAIKGLQVIYHQEQMKYSTRKKYVPLTELFEGEDAMLSPERYILGYRFSVKPKDDGKSYEAWASPVDYRRTGRRSFYQTEKGVIHSADKQGGEATAADPEIK